MTYSFFAAYFLGNETRMDNLRLMLRNHGCEKKLMRTFLLSIVGYANFLLFVSMNVMHSRMKKIKKYQVVASQFGDYGDMCIE